MTRDRALKVAIFSELPTPYRWPVFERLLQRDDLDVRLFYCARTESDRDWSFNFRPGPRVRFLPVRTASINGRRTVHYHFNPTVFRELRQGRFDVVVLPGWAMFVSHAGAIWCQATGTPYIIFSETTGLGRGRSLFGQFRSLILRRLVGAASAWLATGTLSREHLCAHGADNARVFPFPNSPDVDALGTQAGALRRKRQALRADLGATSDPVVLFVGRLMGVKRCDLLLEAARGLVDRGIDAEIWIAGDGPERGELMKRACAQGRTRVKFLGNVPSAKLPDLYVAADLFVLPSDHEPWGVVVGEALSCGLPVVVSDRVGCAPDLVSAKETGAVFRHGDAGDLLGTLERLLRDPALLERMGTCAGERMRVFSHERCVDWFLEAVHAAVG